MTNPFKSIQTFFSKDKNVPNTKQDITRVQFSNEFSLVEKEVRNKDYVFYGIDNLLPQHLKNLMVSAPTQKQIIKTRAAMMSGQGFLINGAKTKEESDILFKALPLEVQDAYKTFMTNEYYHMDMDEIRDSLCYDFQFYGAFALECIWDLEFTAPTAYKPVSVATLRAGKMHEDKVSEYYYSRNWYHPKGDDTPVPYPAFDINNKTSCNQYIYVKQGQGDYYGEVNYSVNLVELEAALQSCQLNSILNGFSPGMVFTYYQTFTKEQQKQIVNGLKYQNGGPRNVNDPIFIFAPSKELAPTITPVDNSNVTAQYNDSNSYLIQNILTANGVTTPLLFGITTPSSLSAGSELEAGYKIYNNSTVAEDRKKIEKVFNKLLKISNIPITVTIEAYDPLQLNKLTEKVQQKTETK